MRNLDLLLTISFLVLLNGFTSAEPTPPVLTVGTENSPWVLAYTDANDLLQTHLESMTSTGDFGLWGFGATAGSLNNATMGWYTGWASDFASWQANASVTYYLDPNDPSDPNLANYGYDITNITTYAGSSGNGHDDQNYTIYYRVVGGTDWYLYSSINWTPHYPNLPNDGQYSSCMNKAEWTVALQNVDAIKFVAPASVENTFVTLCEIDVIGTTSTELVNPLIVNAGLDQATWLDGGFVDVSLDGTVSSFIPYTVQWSVNSQPNGSTVQFTPATADIEDPFVTFDTAGIYVLQLTADDGDITRSETTTVTVYPDACAYAQVQPGFAWNVSDANHDCQVTLDDFAILAANWLECYHPGCL